MSEHLNSETTANAPVDPDPNNRLLASHIIFPDYNWTPANSSQQPLAQHESDHCSHFVSKLHRSAFDNLSPQQISSSLFAQNGGYYQMSVPLNHKQEILLLIGAVGCTLTAMVLTPVRRRLEKIAVNAKKYLR